MMAEYEKILNDFIKIIKNNVTNCDILNLISDKFITDISDFNLNDEMINEFKRSDNYYYWFNILLQHSKCYANSSFIKIDSLWRIYLDNAVYKLKFNGTVPEYRNLMLNSSSYYDNEDELLLRIAEDNFYSLHERDDDNYDEDGEYIGPDFLFDENLLNDDDWII